MEIRLKPCLDCHGTGKMGKFSPDPHDFELDEEMMTTDRVRRVMVVPCDKCLGTGIVNELRSAYEPSHAS